MSRIISVIYEKDKLSLINELPYNSKIILPIEVAMLSKLRDEAEKMSAANALRLASRYKNAKYFDESKMNVATKIGGGMNAFGALGIMGLAAANQAAAIGAAGALSSASTALAGLGVVAVGAAAIPVATAVVIGVGAVGSVTLLAGLVQGKIERNSAADRVRTMQYGYDESSYIDNALPLNAIRRNDTQAIEDWGRKNIGAIDVVKAVKSMVIESISSLFKRGDEFTLDASSSRQVFSAGNKSMRSAFKN